MFVSSRDEYAFYFQYFFVFQKSFYVYIRQTDVRISRRKSNKYRTWSLNRWKWRKSFKFQRDENCQNSNLEISLIFESRDLVDLDAQHVYSEFKFSTFLIIQCVLSYILDKLWIWKNE